jgi:L-ascorbate metabolism protein UlaG (beta-lactamase superfamily)
MAKLRFFGVAAYEIVNSKGQHILIDPFIDSCPGNPVKSSTLDRVDLICVTHAAPDHYGDTLEIARRTNAPVICGADVKEHLKASGLLGSQVTATCWNIRVEVNGIQVHPLECHHWSHIKLPDGRHISGVPMAFIIHVDEGIRFYHYGDTAIFSDLKLQGKLYKPTHAAIGITQPTEILHTFEGPDKVLTGEMNPYEGFLASQWLGAKFILPCHYINPDHEDVREFERHILENQRKGNPFPKSVVMRPGDWIDLEPVFDLESTIND